MSEEPQEETSVSEETATVQPEQSDSKIGQTVSYLRQNPAWLIVIVVFGFALLAMCLMALLLVREMRQDETDATPVAQVTLTPLATPAPSQPQVHSSGESGTISVTLGSPILLKLSGQEFEVQTNPIGADGIWEPGVQEAGEAAWVKDTIVNYVLGLPDRPENESLLAEMAPGDEIQLITNGRASYTFAFTERELVPINDPTVYAQQSPGITIILLEADGDQRLMVRGRYVIAEAESAPQNVVNMGDTAQLDNIQLTLNSATYVADRGEIPAGFAFFQVDYQIQNVGLTAYDSSGLEMSLVDELGNRYALNPAASQSGNYPLLNGFLNANQSANASAGYQVPLGLNSETVSWVVTNKETGAQVFVTLPFTGGETAAQGSSISLFQAEVSADLTSLNLGGQITNLGTQPLVVTESNVKLSSGDGTVYLLLSTNPPFPWTVSPGQTIQYFVAYQRPPTGTTIFRVLNQEFQVTEQ
ncbi:MAG: DUF4352 domain-containing protein [Chloroflexi bacterium]|nr:DUF4352 domain-containing protein [Chloroflexota bacterium]